MSGRRKIEIPHLPLQGAAEPGWTLGIPAGQNAVVHYYDENGCYLHSSVVRDGGLVMVWPGAKYWHAEQIPITFSAVPAQEGAG